MKYKIILLVMIVLSGFFVSCAKTNTQEEWEPPKRAEATEDGNSKEEEPGKSDGIKTISFVFRGYGDNGQPYNKTDINYMTDALNKRLSQELDCEIEFEWVHYKEYSQKVPELVASGAPPDAIQAFFRNATYIELADTDLLADITDLYRLNMPSAYSLFNSKMPDLFENLIYDDGVHLLPPLYADPVRNCVMVQKEIYSEYGKSFSTLEEYGEFLKWSKANYPELIPCYGSPISILRTYIEGNGYIQETSSFYKHIDDPQMQVIPVEQLKEFTAVFNMIKAWHENGYICNIDEVNEGNEVKSGKIISVVRDYKSSNTRGYLMNYANDIEYEHVVLYPETKQIYSFLNQGLIFPKEADATNEAMRFIEWLYQSREDYELLHYGIENEQYKLIDGKISLEYEGGIKPIADWYGSDCFLNYTLERPSWNEPDDYERYFLGYTLDNTVSLKQYYGNCGIDIDKIAENEESIAKTLEDTQREINNMCDIRYEVYTKFYERLNTYSLNLTSEETIEMLSEANGPEIAELLNNIYKYVKEN